MGENESLVTGEIRQAIGKPGPEHILEIERGAIRQYARAARYDNPIYYDVEAARATGHPDLPVPPGFLGRHIYIPGTSDETFSTPKDARLPGNPKLIRGLNGGQWVRYYRRIHAGERLTETTTCVSATERTGRLGPMLIMEGESTFRDEQGEIVAKSGFTSINY